MRSENQTRPSCLRGILILRPGIIASRLRARNAHTAMYARTRISISWLPTSMIERPCRPGFFFFVSSPSIFFCFFFSTVLLPGFVSAFCSGGQKARARARIGIFVFGKTRRVSEGMRTFSLLVASMWSLVSLSLSLSLSVCGIIFLCSSSPPPTPLPVYFRAPDWESFLASWKNARIWVDEL